MSVNKEVTEVINKWGKKGFTLFLLFAVLSGQTGPVEEFIPLPPYAEPRRTHDFFPPQTLEFRARYIRALYALPDADKYLMGLANTLEMMVAMYVAYEARLPATLDEFLNSPYNNLASQAWVNPYTGEKIEWTNEPRRGHLSYSASDLRVIPWLPTNSVPIPFYSKDLVRRWGNPSLGIWRLHPADLSLILYGSAISKAMKSPNTCIQYKDYPCWIRRYHAVEKRYSEAEWKTFVSTEALSLMFVDIGSHFEMGLPETLEEARQNYWWFYNTLFQNPFTGALMKEVPFESNSSGDFTFAVESRGPHVLPYFIPRGENGRLMWPMDEGDTYTMLMNLSHNDYVRGLEGRSLCELMREKLSPELWEKDGKWSCEKFAEDFIFLSSFPRSGQQPADKQYASHKLSPPPPIFDY